MEGGVRKTKELECVGRLEIVRPKPVGFLCGSIPVPTDQSFHSFNSALVPSSPEVSAPRYRMLPTETDLNMPPRADKLLPDKLLPIDYGALRSSTATNEGITWDDGAITCDLTRKGEALAVSGLVEYGDEIDVIAPADILKQIFKMPYSKARLSIAVHRVGQTLILNAGPGVEEGERLVRRNQPKCSDESLFLNFAMQSVRMEACDCPPTHPASTQGLSKSSVLPDLSGPENSSFESSDIQCDDFVQKEGHEEHAGYSKGKKDGFQWRSKKNKGSKARDPVKKGSQYGEKPRCPAQESEKYRSGNDEFLRVLFWQFHNFRMLLGSDLLLFSNDKYVSVSLHLWDVSRQVTPLTWLEAWLDNVMASVPELAICYHRNGVVQGYELLKTDDIFLLKGISEDGTPGFHPYIVQQNGLSVLRFLQANCKQDPGAYWLYKNAGEDVIQLFDLSVIPQNRSSECSDGCSSSLPSLIHKGRADSLLSLGMLLYRTAHRLSLTMAPNNRARCAWFFKKCLELLDEPDHLVVRAFAHEQFARLILNSEEELDLALESFPMSSGVIVTDEEEESLEIVSSISECSIHESYSDPNNSLDSLSESSCGDILEINISSTQNPIPSDVVDSKSYSLCDVTSGSNNVIQTITDPISSRLAAVHHVSQAIKSLRWTRQLHDIESEFSNDGKEMVHGPNFSVCACGETDCIEVCDIREWLPNSKLDHKLWKLILLLGESYLALGQAYRESGQLLQALKVVEVACSVYGSVPQYLDNAEFVSSMGSGPMSRGRLDNGRGNQGLFFQNGTPLKTSVDDRVNLKGSSSTYLFWAKAWTLVGDVYIDFLDEIGKRTSSAQELKMSSEVVKELIRLKKKLGRDVVNCTSCSLVNCSCRSDRVSSGNNASSSTGETGHFSMGKKQSKRSSRGGPALSSGNPASNRTSRTDMGRDSEVARDDKDNWHGETGKCFSDRGSNKEGISSSVDSGVKGPTESNTGEPPKIGGGIFKYLRGPETASSDDILSTALCCYEAARTALDEFDVDPHELHSVVKKIGWTCNELGRYRLERKDLAKAELAFARAIGAFREVSDRTNIILINCNLGHGRRALAEELVSKMEYLKSNSMLYNTYKQVLDTAIMEYSVSIRFYTAAKSELSAVSSEEADDLGTDLKNEACTQLAHTYLRLGMLLAREDTVADISVRGSLEDKTMNKRTKKKDKKGEISANDAIREALSLYESLGELRKQEAAYAYFQLGCYQRDCCLKFVSSSHTTTTMVRSSNQCKDESGVLQRAKQYLSLAERNWQKAIEFYGAKTHPFMYVTILIERADLLSSLSSSFHSYMMLETALSCLLEGRHITDEPNSDIYGVKSSEAHTKYWKHLQNLLKKMLGFFLTPGPHKTVPVPHTRRCGDAEKLKELYKMSLKCMDFNQLHSMHSIWIQDHRTKAANND